MQPPALPSPDGHIAQDAALLQDALRHLGAARHEQQGEVKVVASRSASALAHAHVLRHRLHGVEPAMCKVHDLVPGEGERRKEKRRVSCVYAGRGAGRHGSAEASGGDGAGCSQPRHASAALCSSPAHLLHALFQQSIHH